MAGLLSDIRGICDQIYRSLPGVPAPREVEKIIIKEVDTMIQSRGFVRIAGLSGALSVAMAAYGAHGFAKPETEEEKRLKMTFEIGNRMHMLHSAALLASPVARKPVLVGSLLTVGMMLFSGSCYYHALTRNQRVRYITPYGGMLLIFAWLAMVL